MEFNKLPENKRFQQNRVGRSGLRQKKKKKMYM